MYDSDFARHHDIFFRTLSVEKFFYLKRQWKEDHKGQPDENDCDDWILVAFADDIFICAPPGIAAKMYMRLNYLVQEELKMDPLKLTINPATKIRKAVITAAGFNPGLFPAMKAVRPELFPVVKSNHAFPAILINVEQILAAGIEKVKVLAEPV